MNLLVSTVAVTLVLFFLVAVIILFALYKKGDVSAAFSLRSFAFSLHASDRHVAEPPQRPANSAEHQPPTALGETLPKARNTSR